jgi:hypothetical protein
MISTHDADKFRPFVHLAILAWLGVGYVATKRASWMIDVVAFVYFMMNVANFAYVSGSDQRNPQLSVIEKETEHVVMLCV